MNVGKVVGKRYMLFTLDLTKIKFLLWLGLFVVGESTRAKMILISCNVNVLYGIAPFL